MNELLKYFNGDESAATAWLSKYCVKDKQKNPMELTPDDMHRRMAREFYSANKQHHYQGQVDNAKWNQLSHYGRHRENLTEDAIYNLFKGFKQIVPQGSIMTILGNPYVIGSLSNCFVVGQPYDSYGGIFQKDQQLAQLMKRRGGVGIDISTLRPESVAVTNSAGASTGAVSFMHRFSNTTREVAQKGRRGALMITIDCRHPDLAEFINVKKDLTKITGANISVKLRDEFYQAVENNEDYFMYFPCDKPFTISQKEREEAEYGVLYTTNHADGKIYWRKEKAVDLFNMFVENNWASAEPGSMNVDRHWNYSPDTVYPQFKGVTSNPCGEIFMGPYDACRLMAINLMGVVDNPYTSGAKLNIEMLYKLAYEQQVLADDLVTLELDRISSIIGKICSDPEPVEVKQAELDLWDNIYDTAKAGRRTGCGFTALGDLIAALGFKYDSPQAKVIIKQVMQTKMLAELDATIDMSIIRGPFEGWDRDKEFAYEDPTNTIFVTGGMNDFYKMIHEEFYEQAQRMAKFGRRNVSWNTVAPTGTVSLMTQTTSGLEPLFSLEPYTRRRKVNPDDKSARIDFTDENGDNWQNFPIFHPQVFEWWRTQVNDRLEDIDEYISLDKAREFLEKANPESLSAILDNSPWHGSTANDIDWIERVQIQSIIQHYTTHSISSTINLPADVSKEKVKEIYMQAWKQGLKGVTIYRDGCRSGVLIKNEEKVAPEEFAYYNAPERPKELEAELHYITSKGSKYAVIVGLYEGKPYEVFAYEGNSAACEEGKGKVIKNGRGHYSFTSECLTIPRLELKAEEAEQAVLCRFVSMLLRHGARPEYVIEQINKSDLSIISFGKAIGRVLKGYIPEDAKTTDACPTCGEHTLVYEEGCLSCKSCGFSKC